MFKKQFQQENTSKYKYISRSDINQERNKSALSSIRMANLTKSKNECLEKNVELCITLPEVISLLHELQVNNQAEFRLFYRFLEYASIFKRIFPSQEHLASMLGISREWVNKLISKLVEKGLLLKKRRYNTTCLYGIPEIFNNIKVRFSLSRLLPILGFSLSLLISSNNFAQLTNDEYISKTRSGQDLPGEFTSNNVNYLFKSDIGISVYEYQDTKYKNNLHMQSVPDVYATICKRGQNMEVKFRPTIEEITEINLTTAGKCKLSAFSDSAIQHGRLALRKAKGTPTDPFKYMMKSINNYRKENNLDMNSSLERELEIKYGVKHDDPKFTHDKRSIIGTESINGKNRSHETYNYNHSQELPANYTSNFKPAGYNRDPIDKYFDFMLSLYGEGVDMAEYLIPGQIKILFQKALIYAKEKDKKGTFPNIIGWLKIPSFDADLYAKSSTAVQKYMLAEFHMRLEQEEFHNTPISGEDAEKRAEANYIQYKKELAAQPAAEASRARAQAAKLDPSWEQDEQPDPILPESDDEYSENSNEDQYGVLEPWMP